MIFSANPNGAPALHNPSGRRTTFAGRKEIVHLFFRSACDEGIKKEKRNMPSDTFRHYIDMISIEEKQAVIRVRSLATVFTLPIICYCLNGK